MKGARGTPRSAPRGVAAVTAAIVIAAIIAVVAFALTANSRSAPPAADPSAPGVAAASAAATSTAASAPAATSASAAARKTEPAASTPAATATTAAPTPSTASPAAAASTPVLGALSEYPAGGTLALPPNGPPGRQIDLSGSGSGDWHVNWSLTVANDPDDVISVSSSAGTLTPADPTATVTVTANHFVPCGWRQSPTITVSPGGAVFSVCTSWFRNFTGDDPVQADDDAAYASPPGREPAQYGAGLSRGPGTGGHHGRAL